MKKPQWDPEEIKEIKERIRQGFISEATLKEVDSTLTSMEKALIEQFSSANPIYYQNVDNSPLFVLHLKVRVIRELRQSLTVQVDMGRAALEQKAEMELQGAKFDG